MCCSYFKELTTTRTRVVSANGIQIPKTTLVRWKGELARGVVNNEKALQGNRGTEGKAVVAQCFVEWYITQNGVNDKATGRTNHDDEVRILIDKVTRSMLMREVHEYYHAVDLQGSFPTWFHKPDMTPIANPIGETTILNKWNERMEDTSKVRLETLT
jgi:hypothetical protein